MLDCADRKEGKGWKAFGGEITVVGPQKLHLFGRGVAQGGSRQPRYLPQTRLHSGTIPHARFSDPRPQTTRKSHTFSGS